MSAIKSPCRRKPRAPPALCRLPVRAPQFLNRGRAQAGHLTAILFVIAGSGVQRTEYFSTAALRNNLEDGHRGN